MPEPPGAIEKLFNGDPAEIHMLFTPLHWAVVQYRITEGPCLWQYIRQLGQSRRDRPSRLLVLGA